MLIVLDNIDWNPVQPPALDYSWRLRVIILALLAEGYAAIIPLVKCKNGDLADVNNYRAIAISNSISKILESVLYNFIPER